MPKFNAFISKLFNFGTVAAEMNISFVNISPDISAELFSTSVDVIVLTLCLLWFFVGALLKPGLRSCFYRSLFLSPDFYEIDNTFGF